MKILTQKWIRPNMVLNISHFGIELGHLRREKKRGKRRREEEKKKEEGRREVQEFKVWILVKELYSASISNPPSQRCL